MQVNAQVKSCRLTEGLRKHSSHAKLGTETFDTVAKNSKGGLRRVMDFLKKQGKENLKNLACS